MTRIADAVTIAVTILFLSGATKPWLFPIGRRQITVASVEMEQQRREMEEQVYSPLMEA